MLSSTLKDSTFFPLFLLRIASMSCIPGYQYLTTQNAGFHLTDLNPVCSSQYDDGIIQVE